MAKKDITDNRNIAEADSEWDSGIKFSPDSNTYKLVRALLSEADRIDGDLEDIYNQHHINTATGDDLEKIGDLVNVRRNTGEGDDSYRARIKGKFGTATVDSTFDEFAEFVSAVLNTDIDNIDYLTNYQIHPAAVTVSTQASVYSNISLSSQQIVNILGDGVPAGHEVRVLEEGTFQLKEDGDADDPDKGLTSDSISSGGTLAADLV